jgi:hypothetical protein
MGFIQPLTEMSTRRLYRVQQRKRMFFDRLVLDKKGGDFRLLLVQLKLCSFSSHGAVDLGASTVCLRNLYWNKVRNRSSAPFPYTFNVERAMETFLIVTQYWDGSKRLEQQGVMKRKPPGLPATVRRPEDIKRVRVAVLRSPRRSARRQASALRMSHRSVRRN